MNRFRRANRAAIIASAAATSLALAAPASAQETFKLGIVTFLSGPAADSFGVPARNGAQFVIDQLNKGAAPSPYEKVGFGGMKIEPVIIDENGGATKQVQELRNLYQRDNVDVVLGYIGSGDCLAVAPIAEELKKMLVLMDCGTPRIFEEAKYNYVFRTAAHATMDNVGLIRYMKAKNIKMDTLVGDQPGLRLGTGQPGRLRRRSRTTLSRRQAADGPAAEVRRRPVRHRNLRAGRRRLRRGLFQPVGRRSAGLHPAIGAARPAEAQPAGVQRRRSRAAAARRQDARRHHHRRARRLRPDVAEIAAERLAVQGL